MIPTEFIVGAIIGTIGGIASAVLVPVTRYGLARALAASVTMCLLCAVLSFGIVYAVTFYVGL
jgi:hypothetical protein